jgi:hypothetical protein
MQLCGSSGDGSGTIVGVIDTPPGGVLLGQPMAGPAGAAGPVGPVGPVGPIGPAGASGGAVDVATGMSGAVIATTIAGTDEVPFLSGTLLKRITVANLKLNIDGGSP